MNAGGILPKLFLNDTNIYKIMVFVDLAAKPHRISWEANLGQVEIPFDSIPFYVVGFQVLFNFSLKKKNNGGPSA